MREILLQLTADPLFGIASSIAAYAAALWLNRKVKSPAANPLLMAGAMLILLLWALDIPLENFQKGGDVCRQCFPCRRFCLEHHLCHAGMTRQGGQLPAMRGDAPSLI